MSVVDVEHFREQLLDERKRVLAAIDNIRHENPGSLQDETEEMSVDNHLGDVATATFDRELASTLEEHEAQVLAAIDAALKRIDEGTYGSCAKCGKPIGEERLEARPWARLCIEDQRKEERG